MSDEQKTLAVRSEMPVEARGIVINSLATMAEFARVICNSGLAPRDFKTPEAVMVAIQHGMELGLSPMQSVHSIAVINGKPGIYGDAALALCNAHPDFENIEETFDRGAGGDDNIVAQCVVTRKGRSPTVRTFSVADAKKAGLWGKAGPWTQYPKRMLQMRARGFALRDSFPDSLKGIGIREELADIPEKPANIREVTRDLPEPIQFADEPAQIADAEPAPEIDPKTGLAKEDLFK